jgi:phosphoglycerate-specific signal transduction histidine kinase
MKPIAEVELVINLTVIVRSLRLFTRRMSKGLELWALKLYNVVKRV